MKFFAGLMVSLGVLLGVSACGQSAQLDPNKIYFFTKNGCPHCERAEQYIQATYPTLPVTYQNVAEPESMDLLLACADKFNLDKSRLGTPLICMGDKHFLGWSDENKVGFDNAVQKFVK
ncbi:MAG: hypothetical protein IKY98_02150 [Alphaproteobacteria bacterium]|nr:hypothetical protein [Alphaproteobacteria bacterium]